MMDDIIVMPLDQAENRLEEAKTKLAQLPVGISYFIIHPAVDSPELRAVAQDWRCRVADYELFTSDQWLSEVEASGVKVIGWRAIRDLLWAGV